VTRISPSRCVLALALACTLGALPACGGDEPDADTGALGSTADPTPTTTSATPTKQPTKQPTKTRTPKPSPTETVDEGGSGDGEGDDSPATAGGGVCSDISAGQVGDVLGVLVSGSGISGGGCQFKQAGKSGTTVTILDKSAARAGGLAGAKQEATSAVEGEPENLSGIGAGAFVVTGTIFGGTDIQAAGAVKVGDRIISAFLVQRSGVPAAKVRTLEINLLELIARAKG
jgi:hypothetical protein